MKRLLVLLVILLVGVQVVNGQNGPDFTVTLNPQGSQQVGQSVNIHVVIHASTYGASKITVSCDGVSKVETSEIVYDSTWRTGGCSNGGQSVLVCAKTALDEQWHQANCKSYGYNLTGSTSVPHIDFWADDGNLQSGQCTTMHWNTTNANTVIVEGNSANISGTQQICPTVTKMYNISATNSAGTAYANFSVTVTVSTQPNTDGPTNTTANQPQNVPSAPGRPTLAQARQNHTPGGVDVVVFCAAKGWGSPSSASDYSNNAANSWHCGNISLGDFNQVCDDVFGTNYYAINVMESNRLGGWRCVTQGQSVDQTSPTSGSNSGGTRFGDGALQLDGGSNSPPSGQWVRIITGQLNVRSQPVIDPDNIIGKAQNGGYYQIISGPQNGWYLISYNGGQGWVSGGSQYVEVGNVNTPQQPQSQPSSDNNCGPSPSRLSPGMMAAVSDFDPSSLVVYNNSVRSSGQLYTVSIREWMNIISVAVCSEGRTWVEVEYQGRRGWTEEVNRNGTYNLVPSGMPLPGPGGRGGTVPNQTEPVGQQPDSSFDEAYHVVTVRTFAGSSYSLIHDEETNTILNGLEFTFDEVIRVGAALASRQGVIGGQTDELIDYANPIGGEGRFIADQVDRQTNSTVCYKISSGSTDTSGVANIVFGYYMAYLGYGESFEDLVANATQGVNPDTFLQFGDFPDDNEQRRVGRMLYERDGNNPSMSTLSTLVSNLVCSVA